MKKEENFRTENECEDKVEEDGMGQLAKLNQVEMEISKDFPGRLVCLNSWIWETIVDLTDK